MDLPSLEAADVGLLQAYHAARFASNAAEAAYGALEMAAYASNVAANAIDVSSNGVSTHILRVAGGENDLLLSAAAGDLVARAPHVLFGTEPQPTLVLGYGTASRQAAVYGDLVVHGAIVAAGDIISRPVGDLLTDFESSSNAALYDVFVSAAAFACNAAMHASNVLAVGGVGAGVPASNLRLAGAADDLLLSAAAGDLVARAPRVLLGSEYQPTLVLGYGTGERQAAVYGDLVVHGNILATGEVIADSDGVGGSNAGGTNASVYDALLATATFASNAVASDLLPPPERSGVHALGADGRRYRALFLGDADPHTAAAVVRAADSNLRLEVAGSAGAMVVGTQPPDGELVEHVRVTGGGLVGIGTPAPFWPLHVAVARSNTSIWATGDIVAFSDARFKRECRVVPDALARLSRVNGYTYERVEDDPTNARRLAGVLAQEVRDALPEVVHADAEGRLAVAYGNLSALLVQAVKELHAEHAVLAARVAAALG